MITKQDILEEFNEEVPATRKMLGVYLKMNGIAHPAVYGPSGDEQ
jgi:hypothetical protein